MSRNVGIERNRCLSKFSIEKSMLHNFNIYDIVRDITKYYITLR